MSVSGLPRDATRSIKTFIPPNLFPLFYDVLLCHNVFRYRPLSDVGMGWPFLFVFFSHHFLFFYISFTQWLCLCLSPLPSLPLCLCLSLSLSLSVSLSVTLSVSLSLFLSSFYFSKPFTVKLLPYLACFLFVFVKKSNFLFNFVFLYPYH